MRKYVFLLMMTLLAVDMNIASGREPVREAVVDSIRSKNLFPGTFLKTKEPRLMNGNLLSGIFRKLKAHREPVRIVQLGDSHVRGHVFSVETRRVLEEAFGKEAVEEQTITYKTNAIARETGKPGLVYHAMGINGATYSSFDSFEKIVQVAHLKPDLIILSFGTNEAHGRNYSDNDMKRELDSLIIHLKKRVPNTVIMLTSPPGSYWSNRVSYVRNRRRRYTYRRTVNTNTPKVVACMREYAKEKGLVFFDLYDTVGGEVFALKNWQSQGMLGKDGIHYSHEGYKLMGRLLAQVILKEWGEDSEKIAVGSKRGQKVQDGKKKK